LGCSKDDDIEVSKLEDPFESLNFNMDSFTVNIESVVEEKTVFQNGLATVTKLKLSSFEKVVNYSKKDKMITGIDNINRTDLTIYDKSAVLSNVEFGTGHSPMLSIWAGSAFVSTGRTTIVAGKEGSYKVDTYYYFKK
jgi:hypothetical protein